jgi:Pvc16 N-terminal domain
MANYVAVYSVGSSLVTYLRNSYQTARTADAALPPCDFALLSSGEMQKESPGTSTLSLYLYRVILNEHLRNVPRDDSNGIPPLALDLHYLLNVWSDQASVEHTVLAWAMRQLYHHETLSASDLSPEPGWGPGDLIQVIPAELTNEDLMRIWDAINLPYRLSVSYIARVVRIDSDAAVPATMPVVARRFGFEDGGGGSS